MSRRGAKTHLGGNTKQFANAVNLVNKQCVSLRFQGGFENRVLLILPREKPSNGLLFTPHEKPIFFSLACFKLASRGA